MYCNDVSSESSQLRLFDSPDSVSIGCDVVTIFSAFESDFVNFHVEHSRMTGGKPIKLTKRAVGALHVSSGDTVVWDRDLPGFGIKKADMILIR